MLPSIFPLCALQQILTLSSQQVPHTAMPQVRQSWNTLHTTQQHSHLDASFYALLSSGRLSQEDQEKKEHGNVWEDFLEPSRWSQILFSMCYPAL